MRNCAAALCFLQLASALCAAEPASVRLAVSEGKDIRFAHLTSRNGLSFGQIRDIVQDDQGFLWFNTSNVPNRYDPRTGRFTAFRHDPADPHSLSHDTVYSLMVDRQGALWAGTGDGFSVLDDPATGRFRSWKADPAGTSLQEVTAVIEDPDGVLWLVSGTLQRFDPTTGRFTAYKLGPSSTGAAEQVSSSTLVRMGKG